MSDIPKFYEGQNVFITGGTGFIGKILFEKLLRSCPQIGKIYLLMRAKKEKTTYERLNEITNLPIFEPLRKINPDFQRKLVPISGDAMKPGLGISAEDRALITQEVSIIFHVAANTKFEESLRLSVPININSIMELISLCRECKNLKAAVYVSTAFSQCINENIKEKVYPMPMSYEDINNAVQIIKHRNFSEEEETAFTKILLGNFPNTYVFTKSIAEGVLNEKAKHLPFSIFRFPIALATYKEPMPGWFDTAQGFNQATMGIALGVIRVLHVDTTFTMHMVPADYACNALIATARETNSFQNRDNPDELPVYNYAACEENSFTAEDIRTFALKKRTHCTPLKAVYYPYTYMFKSDKLFTLFQYMLHLIPALLGDVIMRILGRKPIFYKIYQKGTKLMKAGRFSLQINIIFESTRVLSMWNKLSKADKELMFFDLTTIDWDAVGSETWNGTLKYLLKDNASPEERSRKLIRLRRIHRTIQVISATLIIWLIWKLTFG